MARRRSRRGRRSRKWIVYGRAWLRTRRSAVPIAAGAALLALTLLAGGLWPSGAGDRPAPLTNRPDLIAAHAERTGLSRRLIAAVIEAESSGDPHAVSSAGARGLMQIRPAAEQDALGVLGREKRGDLFDPSYNVLIGTTYLAHLHKRFDGDTRLMLAAYHMGPTRVARLRREHPDLDSEALVERFAGPATKAYVTKVLRLAQ